MEAARALYARRDTYDPSRPAQTRCGADAPWSAGAAARRRRTVCLAPAVGGRERAPIRMPDTHVPCDLTGCARLHLPRPKPGFNSVRYSSQFSPSVSHPPHHCWRLHSVCRQPAQTGSGEPRHATEEPHGVQKRAVVTWRNASEPVPSTFSSEPKGARPVPDTWAFSDPVRNRMALCTLWRNEHLGRQDQRPLAGRFSATSMRLIFDNRHAWFELRLLL
jgi:hypothetical protein